MGVAAVIEENEALYRDWQRARAAEGYADLPRNRQALRSLEAHAGGRPLDGLGRADVQGWLGSLDWMAPSSRASYFSSARAFFNWAASEEEAVIGRSPMAGMRAPKDPLPPAPIPEEADVRLLIAVTERDRTPMGTRDAAMIRLMADTGGPRASELAGLLIAGRDGVPDKVGLDLDRDWCGTVGKGGAHRQWPIAAKTGRACARWVRARARLPQAAGHARLWVGFRIDSRPVTRSGVGSMLERRCAEAGIKPVHPHQLRHLAYHAFLLAGGREGDAMLLFGWQDDAMPRRYARELAAGRALQAGQALAIGDRW